MPFDLSDNTGTNQPASSPGATHSRDGAGGGQDPGRASDILRQGAAAGGGKVGPGALPMSDSLPFIVCDRPTTPFDGFIKSVTALVITATVLGLAYLLWALFSGQSANPAFSALTVDNQHRILQNLQTVGRVVYDLTWVGVLACVFLYYDMAPAGYILAAVAALFSFGIPPLAQEALVLEHAQLSKATALLLTFFGGLGWAPGAPGILLLVLEGARRVLFSLQEAKVRRSKLKFGRNVAVHAKRRNVFLGACWNMPYCREAIRAKCPIHVQHKGPCWRHKRGCMCEESIATIATSAGDWKSKVSGAMDKIEGRAAVGAATPPARSGNPLLAFSDGSGRASMTDAERAQRCRECVIYNTHQEQKYKALVGAVFVGAAAALYLTNGTLLAVMSNIYLKMNSAMEHFSLSNTGGASAAAVPLSNNLAGDVSWFIIVILAILIISKLLQLVEYCCFKIKI